MQKPKGVDLAHWSSLKEARVACMSCHMPTSAPRTQSLGREELLRIRRKRV